MRADERALIVALLEQEYASPEAAAEAVFDGVVDILMRRDSYGLGLTGIAWGPFYSQREVKKVAAVIGAGIAKLYAPQPLIDRALTPLSDNRYCPGCEHPWIAHIDTTWKWKGERWKRQPGCCAKDCTCTETFGRSKRGQAA